jgi:ADP-ribosylation factor-binding protein GGA
LANADGLMTRPGNACDLANYEPNLALNLEVVDLINSKKGNA